MIIRCQGCGAVLGGFKKYVTLSDGCICKKCFERLGFNYNDKELYSDKSYHDIACGYNAYTKRQQKKVASDFGFSFAHYGEQRDVDATEGENMVYDVLCDMFHNLGYDPYQLNIARKSKNYVSVILGDFDIARIKYSDTARWIIIPYAEPKAAKHYIESPTDVIQYNDLLIKNIEYILKYKDIKKEAH